MESASLLQARFERLKRHTPALPPERRRLPDAVSWVCRHDSRRPTAPLSDAERWDAFWNELSWILGANLCGARDLFERGL